MHRHELEPDAVTMTAAVGACASAAKWEKALGAKLSVDLSLQRTWN